jgi:integrase
LKRKTVARRISSLSVLWGWLEVRGLAPKDSNPWLRQLRGKRGKRGQETQRSQWKDAELVKLLNGEMTPQYTATLHDLVRLALVTGARLNELCSLKTSDVEKRRDGWWIVIREGKTQAAVREVPIHDSAAHVLERRRHTQDGFLFAGLVAGGPDKRRSWNVSKVFGRYCDKLGFPDEALVFHSLRKTFTEVMEAAAVPETTIKLLIGHTRSSLTYGSYSKGERVELRDIIRKLKYSPALMRAIRSAPLSGGKRKQLPSGSIHHGNG